MGHTCTCLACTSCDLRICLALRYRAAGPRSPRTSGQSDPRGATAPSAARRASSDAVHNYALNHVSDTMDSEAHGTAIREKEPSATAHRQGFPRTARLSYPFCTACLA